MENTDLNLLWAEVQNGKESAFEELYNETIVPLNSLACKLLKDKESARDLLQEIFVDLYFNKSRISPDDTIMGYLHSMVKYKALNLLRNQLREKVRLESFQQINSVAEDADQQSAYNDAVERMGEHITFLPEKCRKVFLLKYYENLSYKQISSQLGISVKTVENHISKAFSILRHRVSDDRVLLVLLAVKIGLDHLH